MHINSYNTQEKVTRQESSPGVEDLAPAQWIGKEVISELSLEECAKLVISRGRKSGQVAGALDTGFSLSGLRSSFFLDLGTLIFLWASCLPFHLSPRGLCGVDPNPWLQGGYVIQSWPIRTSHFSDHSEGFQGGHMTESEPRR